jgi:signal transduction histidine kinase
VMEKRDYSLRVRKTTADEIGELVDSFNAMLAEIGRRADAMRAADQRKDEFLATLAHELRNPLAPIRNALEILRLAGNDPAKAAKAREMMQRQVAQMVRLVDDLIDVSRITTGKLAVRKVVFDLRSALRDAVETARPFVDSRKHALDVRLPRETLPVDGDATRLSQVFSNLLNNAAKYTEMGGRIELAAYREAKEIVVTVKDNGIGLAPESTAVIFDMFMQVDRSLERSQAGLGVGLTLSRRLVELHQGVVEVTSEGKGRGSTFTVRLPASYTRLEEAASPGGPGAHEGPGRRVLLADDNVDFVNSLGQLLSSRGHEVRIAYDGAEAIQAAREFNPDIAFLDIGMPKVHGYDVARHLRREPATAECMLVAVTGWGQEGDRAQAREAGFDRHLVKPVDPAEIEAILEATPDRV